MDGGSNLYCGKKNDEKMLEQIDAYIELIEKAQLPDGYLSTKQIIGERSQNGVTRMGDIMISKYIISDICLRQPVCTNASRGKILC